MKFKKSIALIISAVMVFTCFTSLATAESVALTDISTHWAKDFIQPLVDRGIIKGYEDGTFKPDNPITRAEFCTIITKALVDEKTIADFATTTTTFTDVPASLWSVKFVETAAASGLVKGKSAGIFDPEAFITRQEMAKIMSLVYCLKNSKDFDTLKATYNAGDYDLSDLTTADSWAMSYIQVALVVKVMSGNEDKTFAPLGNVTRAETATVTYRILYPTPTGTPTETITGTPTETITGTPTDTPTGTPTETVTGTPTETPTGTPPAIRSHGEKLEYADITRVNYPDYVQNPVTSMTILADGIANISKNCITCDLDAPEYLFDLGSVQSIQSFAIAGYYTGSQAVLFRLLISEDNVVWKEFGIDIDLKIAQPVIEDKSIYIVDNFDDANNTGRLNPAPTMFDTSTTDEIFTIGNYQTRTHNDVNGNETDTDCFESPMLDTTITSVDWQSYGFVNNDCNYLFHYFTDSVQRARYVKIIGYGNTMKQWYMFSSFTEVQVFGPDAVTE